ncbi:hypothetical protein [Mesorhizobium australicum]|uniref:hypothetical protein n=1 Tax=Mesorhizobium australicum TaxID=536018 RepID=UPI00333D1BE9
MGRAKEGNFIKQWVGGFTILSEVRHWGGRLTAAPDLHVDVPFFPIANRAPSAPEYSSCGDQHEVFMNGQCRTLRLCRTEYPHDRQLFPADQPTAWQRLRAAKLALTATFLRYFSDAFLKTLQAALRIAKFMSGFETPMAPLRCNRHVIALQFGNARTQPADPLPDAMHYPSTPANRSSWQHPKSYAGYATET